MFHPALVPPAAPRYVRNVYGSANALDLQRDDAIVRKIIHVDMDAF